MNTAIGIYTLIYWKKETQSLDWTAGKTTTFHSKALIENPLLFFLKIFISFLKHFTIFTKTQNYNNKITIAATTRNSLLELSLKAGAPQKYTK